MLVIMFSEFRNRAFLFTRYPLVKATTWGPPTPQQNSLKTKCHHGPNKAAWTHFGSWHLYEEQQKVVGSPSGTLPFRCQPT